MKELYTKSKYEHGNNKWICNLIGHKKYIVNDIIHYFSKDRMCKRCGRVWFYREQTGELLLED